MAKKDTIETLTREIEQELMPGRFVRYNDMFDFTRHLRQVEEKLEDLVKEGKAADAIPLYEIFLVGAYEKMEECDDSGANLSMFWQGLFCSWIAARQDAECSPEETVGQILKWMESDGWGMCYRIEKDVVKALDKDGRRLFLGHFERVVKDGLAKLKHHVPRPIFEYENDIRLPALQLKDIHEATANTESYAALCERLGISPRDCERLAEMEKSKQRWDKAMAWVEKGLGLESTRNWHNECSHMLDHMRQELLGKLGRTEEALESAWQEFQKYPSAFRYEDLMKYVPPKQRDAWHAKAMQAAVTQSDLGDLMELCVQSGEISLLADHVAAASHETLEAISHYHSEAAAEVLEKDHADQAAKVYRALGLRVLNQKKSKYYNAAIRHLEKARQLYEAVGQPNEWAAIVEIIESDHSRKTSFMPLFRGLLAGNKRESPDFAQRARNRWQRLTS